MPLISRRAAALLLALPVLAAGCIGEPERPAPQEFLDPQTAMTIHVVAEPFIYAREVPELAANVRDYLSVGGATTNNMGTRHHYFALIAWTTLDRKRNGLPSAEMPDRLEYSIDGRGRAFALATHEPRSIGIGVPVLEPPTGFLGESWFVVTPADLRAFAATPPPTIDVLVGGERQTYTLWKRADAALRSFVEDIPTEMQRATPSR